MRIAVFNVKFSSNLGDGLLAQCLEAELKTAGADTTTIALDLAGRTQYGRGGVPFRKTAIAILERLPKAARQLVVRIILRPLVHHRLKSKWRDELKAADAVILGGGNLLADSDLNFPIKIERAMAEARHAHLPVAVYGVGASEPWSPQGQALFRQAFSHVKLMSVAVRDSRSQSIWETHLASVTGLKASVCRDPAVLVARHFPPIEKAGSDIHVALGLTDPATLRYHSTLPDISAIALRDWVVALSGALLDLGWKVSVFTNGSPEDRAYLRSMAPRLQALSPDRLLIEPDFQTPADLAAFISNKDLVLAHRLHANIAAFGYAIPHIGFRWDVKLNSFFQSVGRERFIAEAAVTPVEDVVALAKAALLEGIDRNIHTESLNLARTEIEALVQTFRS